MTTRAFVVSVEPVDAEAAGDRLWGLGVRAIEERLGADGRTELWTSVGDGPGAIERAAGALEATWRWRIEEVDDRPADTWRDFAVPIVVNPRLVIVPAWRQGEPVPGTDPDALVVPIEPAGAFGLGDHPTTRASLQALDRLVTPGDAVLDVGCGTGVLAIVAARRGASPVVAVDVADAAVEATRHNAAVAGVEVTVSTTPVSEVTGAFDLVTANILAPALVAMAGDLARLVAPTGHLVVSGILADRHRHVLDALVPLRPIDTIERDGWVAVTLRRG